MPIAASAAHIDGARRGSDGDHAGAHRPGGGGNLCRAFAALCHRDEKSGDIVVRQVAVEQKVEGVSGLGCA